MYLGSWKVDDLLTFAVNTHTTAGAESDADSPPTYRVYEDETGTPILTGTMALLDDANTLGQYSEQITLSAANGFEKGKCYNVRITATVGGVAGATHRSFQMEAEVDANVVSGAVPSVTGAVGSVTGNVGGNVTGSVGSLATQAKADVNTEAAAALTAYDPPTRTEATSDKDEILAATTAIEADTQDLQTQVGTAGAGLTALGDTRLANLDATVSSRLADADYTAPDNTSIAAILADTGTDGVVVATSSKSGYALSSAGVQAVWEYASRTLTGFGSLAADVTTAVWAAGTRTLTAISDSAGVTTLLDKLAGITLLANWLRALSRKSNNDADAVTEINADNGTGTGTYDPTTDSPEAIRDRGDAEWTGGEGGGVSGSNTVTFTVRDSATLAGRNDVPVILYAADGTSLVDAKRTNASGVAVFTLDSASYYYAIPPVAGYSSVSSTALVVDGAEAVTVDLVALSSASTAPGTRVVRAIVRDASGALKSGVEVKATLHADPSTVDQAIITRQSLSATSDANGIADLTCITSDQFVSGDGVYTFEVSSGIKKRATVAAGSGAVYLEDLAEV